MEEIICKGCGHKIGANSMKEGRCVLCGNQDFPHKANKEPVANVLLQRGVIRLAPDPEKYLERPCYCQDKTHEQYQRTKIAHKICSLCYDKGIIYVPKEG